MFCHGSISGSGRRWWHIRSASLWVVPFSLLVSLVCSGSGEAFPIREWDKLGVENSLQPPPVDVQPGKSWQEPLSGMAFLWIPGGCFKMGSPPNAEGHDADEEPVHPVCLSGFWLGEREVTQQQWQRVMQHNPSALHHEMSGQKDESYPVENISRLDVEAFVSKLNMRHKGRIILNLPTEAQWEYACRNGGEKIPYPGYGQVDQMGWYQANSSGTTQSTGTRMANRLGLFDMSGNVWEWVRDTYDKAAYSHQSGTDPLHSSESPFSVIRGGGWQDTAETLRCANRGFERFTNKRPDLGLRLAASMDTGAEDAEEAASKSNRSSRSPMPF
ncbi:MAG: formylglycine-generating enzyme family protein [Magnetococcales bacterium]|nr:formylglycine-generating enzyme family protein [Magnetococcales bacterium]